MPGHPVDRDSLQALLDFHVEAGVDLALDEHPHDRFAESKPAPSASPPAREEVNRNPAPSAPPPARDESKRQAAPGPRALPRAAAGAPDDAAELAREQARRAR